MEIEDRAPDKRRHKRKNVKIMALLKMGMYLNGRGYVKDIAMGGMCVVAPSVFQFMKQAQANDHVGSRIKVMFPAESLTVIGALVRIDPVRGEGALSVTSTSDDEAWRRICAE